MGDDATVRFGYDGKAVTAGMATIETKLKYHANLLEGTFVRAGKGINSALEKAMSFKGLAAAYGVNQIIGYGKATLETYDLVASESKKLNTSAETLQRVGHAAEILGNTNLETLSKGLLKLRKQIIEEPAGELAQGLEEAGLKAQDFLKLDVDEQVLTLADAFEKASSKGRALPLLTGAMGKSFAELIPLLSAGRGELKGFMDEALVMSDATVAAADELNDRWDIMAGKVGFVGKSLAMSLAQGGARLIGDLGKATGMFDLGIEKPEIDHTGAKAAAAKAEANAANQAKRDAEAKRAADLLLKVQREQLIARDRDLEKRREGIKLAYAEIDILEREQRGEGGKFSEVERLKENSFMTKRAHEHSASGLDAAASIALAAREWAVLIAQQRRAETEKAKAQKSEMSNKRETLDMERKSVDLLEAEAKGQTRKVAKLQEEAYITQRMKELSGLGISPVEAESTARRELKAKKEKEKYLETGRAHIGGVKKKTPMSSALDQFKRNQEKEYEPEGPTRPGYRYGQPVPKYDAFGSPPTSAQRTGRYMGGTSKTNTRGYNELETHKNAQKHVASNSTDLGGKLDTSNSHLSKLVEAMA